MRRPHHREVPPVKRCDRRHAQPLGCRDDRCIDRAEREVSVLDDQLPNPLPVGLLDLHHLEVLVDYIRKKPDLGMNAQPPGEQEGYL